MNRVALLGLLAGLFLVCGCATKLHQLGEGDTTLSVGQKYTLKRDALLSINRGYCDSIENPDLTLANYRAYKGYDPYYTKPIGVVPAGTIILISEIQVIRDDYCHVFGKIPKYSAKKFDGKPIKTRTVRLEKVCGGHRFESTQFSSNLALAQ